LSANILWLSEEADVEKKAKIDEVYRSVSKFGKIKI
jgi:hypothetical protein